MDEKAILRIGRVEDKIKLYEPLLISLQKLMLISDEMGEIYKEIRVLKDSRIEVKGKLDTLFKTQDRVYKEIIEKLESKDITQRLNKVEQNTKDAVSLEVRLKTAEDTIESFKLKGWDLLLRIVPWIIAASTTMYAVLR